ncbi:MAG: hypothetical protein K5905_24195 [Roseibium sp.]|uniref:hypothetical protein n=1 Tax=Roseibium sp. TaxID=1936156 RepID=UPI002628D3D0|nr:hypothetical protein [Roseibium sp.]MCV0428570.1 hypothetical protein [Roseibium sp.]
MRKLNRATKQRRACAAARQRAYRTRQKDRRRPSTEDIAVASFHHIVTTGKSPEARRHFAVLTAQIVEKLVGLGFDPIASRTAFDDLVDRYETGEVLTRGPNNRQGRPDISSFLPFSPSSPHYSMSHGDGRNLGVSAQDLVVAEAEGGSTRRQLSLSTLHVPSTDLELLLEEAVFGMAFPVSVKKTSLVISVDWHWVTPEDQIRRRLGEGYSRAFCEVLLFALDLGADELRLASDGGVCRDLCLFEGSEVAVLKPLNRLDQLDE